MDRRLRLCAALVAALGFVPALFGPTGEVRAGDEASARASASVGEPSSMRAVRRPLESYDALGDPTGRIDLDPAERARSTRAIMCDPLSFPEGESNCGLNAQGQPNDFTNGGCSSTFQFFWPTICDDIICGTAAWNGVYRDTDWYEITIFAEQSLTWEVTPDFDAVIGMAGGTQGVPDCEMVTGISPFRLVDRGETDSITVCLEAGTWWFVVLPSTEQVAFPCGRQYEARLTCTTPCITGACCFDGIQCDEGYTLEDCVGLGGVYVGDGTECATGTCDPPMNDDCANAQTFVLGSMLVADLRTATVEPGEFLGCGQPGGVASVWFKFTGNGERIDLTTCGSEAFDPLATDSVINVYAGADCNSLNFLSCNDDSGCGGNGRLARLCTITTVPNTTYWVQVLAWSEETRGQYTLETSFPCTTPDPTGACCIPMQGGGFCFVVEESDCTNGFDGRFEGAATSCTGVDCSDVFIPDNDDCSGATVLTIPSDEIGTTLYATGEGSIENCGLPVTSPGVWYRVVGNGRTVTAHLCSGNTLFDAQLHVFCDDCGSGVWECVAANDDGAEAGCATRPWVSWCTEPGANYYILVSGVGEAEGQYEIFVEDDGTVCDEPVSCEGFCQISCPPGAVDENEPDCQSGYVDVTNGGCGSNPVVYGIVQPGQPICATSGTYSLGGGRGRDVDWFAFSLDQECEVTWTVRADFLVETFILTDACGPGLFSYAENKGNACQNVVVQTVLAPGDYTLLVQPQFFFGVECGFDQWTGTLGCVPTANNGACCLDTTTCVETTEDYCAQLGGGFGEAGQTCASVSCDGTSDCPADFDLSGAVDVLDFAKFLTNFGTPSGASPLDGDMDHDGDVDVLDFALWLQDFGKDCPTV